MRLWIVVGMVCSLPPLASAATPAKDDTKSAAFEQVTVADTSVGLTKSNFLTTPPVMYAFCRNETAQIRYRADGTDPTSTVGIIIEAGDTLTIERRDLNVIEFIRTGATSGVLSCDYRR